MRILAAEIFVPEIVVGVELDEGDRAVFFCYGAENREADGMIAANADAAGAGFEDGSDSLLDALEGVFDGERIYGEIAKSAMRNLAKGFTWRTGFHGRMIAD